MVTADPRQTADLSGRDRAQVGRVGIIELVRPWRYISAFPSRTPGQALRSMMWRTGLGPGATRRPHERRDLYDSHFRQPRCAELGDLWRRVPMTAKRRRPVLLLMLLVVSILAAGGTGAWLLWSDPDHAATATSPAEPGGTARTRPYLSPIQARELQRQLSSTHPGVQRRALDPAVRAASRTTDPILPAGTTVTVHQHSFAAQTDAIGSVDVTATTPDGVRHQFVLMLHWSENRWLGYTTTERPAS